mmetsp:Transcript_53694/g.123014  ORF Transcript_53694/g.123014 Transcript_53694/m.123014 type:complete len:982 (+) Transcript_53694:43-2988(+)
MKGAEKNAPAKVKQVKKSKPSKAESAGAPAGSNAKPTKDAASVKDGAKKQRRRKREGKGKAKAGAQPGNPTGGKKNKTAKDPSELFLDNPMRAPIIQRATSHFEKRKLAFKVSCGPKEGYRTHGKLAVRVNPKHKLAPPVFGMFVPGSHAIVDALESKAHHPAVKNALEGVRRACRKSNVRGWDDEEGKGELRHVGFTVHRKTGKVSVTLVYDAKSRSENPDLYNQLVSCIRTRQPKGGLHSLWGHFHTGDKHNNAIVDIHGEWKHEFGVTWMREVLFPEQEEGAPRIQLYFPPRVFRQANLDSFRNIVLALRRWIPATNDGKLPRCLELYGGVGTLGLHVIDLVASLTSSDENPHNVECFKKSLRSIDSVEERSRAKYIGLAAKDMVEQGHLADAEIVIVDPPRKGLEPEVLEALQKNKKIMRILYVSCGFSAYLKDEAQLMCFGWKVVHAEGHLLFPGSDHIETFAVLDRQTEPRKHAKGAEPPTEVAEQASRDASLYLWSPDVEMSAEEKKLYRIVGTPAGAVRPEVEILRCLKYCALRKKLVVWSEAEEKVISPCFDRWQARARLAESRDPLIATGKDPDFQADMEACGVLENTARKLATRLRKLANVFVDEIADFAKTKPEHTFVEVSQQRSKFVFKWKGAHAEKEIALSKAYYWKLVELYKGDKEQESDMHKRMFCVALRYFAIQALRFEEAVPKSVSETIRSIFHVKMESFASPFNCSTRFFCSEFPDVDKAFGSQGSFFNHPPVGGCFLLHPPPVSGVIEPTVRRVFSLLSTADAGKKEMVFVVVVPQAKADWFMELNVSVYKSARCPLILPAAEHGFIYGREQMRRRGLVGALNDTAVFVLLSGAAKKKYKVTEDVHAQLKQAFKFVRSPEKLAKEISKFSAVNPKAKSTGEAEVGAQPEQGKKKVAGKAAKSGKAKTGGAEKVRKDGSTKKAAGKDGKKEKKEKKASDKGSSKRERGDASQGGAPKRSKSH